MKMESVTIEKPKLILCDIEGTTSSISFVKDVLFPYVRTKLFSYLTSSLDIKRTHKDIKNLLQQYKRDSYNSPKLDSVDPSSFDVDKDLIEEICRYVFWLMDHDRKVPALKQLQGHIWEIGYKDGEIIGHVYDDVPHCFEKWTSEGIQIGIYSSGSVLAQKLLFAHTRFGDLTKFISFHFDTEIGQKLDCDSYAKIAKQIDINPWYITFITDVPEEALAAKFSKMKPVLCERVGVTISESFRNEYPWIQSFDMIRFDD